MNSQITSAIFDSRAEAETALSKLRSAGVDEKSISIVGQHDGADALVDNDNDSGDGVRTGLGVGMGAGALLGFGALLIPGVGPFIAAGALAQTLGVAGGAIATGALVGTAAGGLVGALTDHGVSDDDARYYEPRIKSGGTFVSVDTTNAGLSGDAAREILYNAGGHTASRPRSEGAIDRLSNDDSLTAADRPAFTGLARDTNMDRGADLDDSARGLGNEAAGNFKQGVAGLTGSESLDRQGMAQERVGEAQQGQSSDRDDMDRGLAGAGQTTRGLGNEAIGNVKQGIAGMTGSESLDRDGAAQERKGEAQQGETSERDRY